MLKKYKILFAEDDEKTRNNMSEILSFITDDLIIVKDGQEALEMYEMYNPDILIMDIEMPHINGLDVTKKIRKENKTIPIVIVTAFTNTEYFLEAIELNLTAFVLKPLMIEDLKEALKKCQVSLNYNKNEQIFINKECYYDIEKRLLFNEEKEMYLTKIETHFLEYMLKHANRLISYEEFEQNIWDEGMSTGAIRSLVRDIRKVLPSDVIVNFPKMGYKLVTV